ncbi:MAG: TolC family protein [Armatimonadetes bacterium]|nr:TolC family protein [Armatimonadota bacterium]
MRRPLIFAALVLTTAAFGQQHLSLSESLRLAHEKSPVLRASQADANAASAGARASRARTRPQLSANGFAADGKQSSILSSSPMVEPPAFMATAPGTFFDGNLSLMFPLIASRLSAMASAAGWQARAAGGEFLEARADLDLRVTEAYYRVLLARQMIAVAETRKAAATELVKNTRALFESGKGIEAAVQRSEAELSSAQRGLTSAKNEEAKAILDLKETIGLDLGTDVVVDGEASPLVPSSLNDAIAAGKQRRGMLLAARARASAAQSDVRAAASQRLPQLYGVAMGDTTNRRDMGGGTIGLTLSFPVFDSGRISAEVAQARSMQEKADAQVRQAELTVEKEIRQASLDLETARANADSAERSLVGAQASYDVIALRVASGKSILVEQLDSLQTLTQAKADLAQARFDLDLAAARLTRAAGGNK